MITVINGCELIKGQQVQVYKNIRKNIFSIRDVKSMRVIAYGTNIMLSHIKIKIQKSGQEKVRREKRKHIHAFITGTFEGYGQLDINDGWDFIYYNPYTTETFIKVATGEQISNADTAYLSDGKCFVQG